MKEEIQDIGDLFKSELENEAMEPKSSGWTGLQPALDKKEFMHFKIYKFNVYYMSLIILTFLFSSYPFVHTLFSDNTTLFIPADEKHKSDILKQTVSDSAESDTAAGFNKENGLKRSASAFMHSGTENKNLSKSLDSLPLLPTAETTANNLSKQTEESVPSKKTTEQQHKVLYITKQDTVVIIDSIDSKTALKRMKKRNK
jgi:hypothetical protein